MDNAQKAIMIGVGLFITIIIISAVLLITNLGTGLINNAQGQLSSISKALQNQITSSFDGRTLTGADVISAVQLYESSEISLVVYVGQNSVAYTGKYPLTYTSLSSSKVATGATGTTLATNTSYPGGVYYTGDYNDFGTTAKVTLTQLQANPGANGYGVNATKTYYSSIIKDNTTDTVVGVVFVQAQ